MAWIKVVEPEEATGALRQEYDAALERAGRVFNILKVQSLNPHTLKASMQMYGATMFGPSGLSRAEREMLATVVSWANHCFY
jgi:uncharacterized peroxidase-related enzyme